MTDALSYFTAKLEHETDASDVYAAQRGGDRFVLVDVDDHVRGRERPQRVELDVLGAADLRYGADRGLRVDAEAGATDHARAQPEVEQQFGDRWHQRDDALR